MITSRLCNRRGTALELVTGRVTSLLSSPWVDLIAGRRAAGPTVKITM